jgi:hypothetical protein
MKCSISFRWHTQWLTAHLDYGLSHNGPGAIGYDDIKAQIDRHTQAITCTCGARATVEYVRVWRPDRWHLQRVVRCKGKPACPAHVDTIDPPVSG